MSLRGTKRTYSRSAIRQDPQYWAKKIKNLELKVRNNTPETKYLHLNGQVTIVTGGDYGVFLTQIVEGLGSEERVGNRIRVKSVECQGETATPIDVYLVKAQDDKDLPAAADFSSTYAGAFTREERLHTYKQTMSGNWATPQSATVFTYPFKISKSFGPSGLLVEFDAAGGAYGDCTRNSLWLMLCNRSPIGTSQRATYNVRVTYTDA